jgi:hypothetical protein
VRLIRRARAATHHRGAQFRRAAPEREDVSELETRRIGERRRGLLDVFSSSAFFTWSAVSTTW